MADHPDADEPEPELSAEAEAELDRSLDLMDSPRAWPPLLRAVDGVRALDLEAMAFAPDLPAHHKMLGMILLLAIKDRASEVHFEPAEAEAAGGAGPTNRLLYMVDGELLDLVPPPDGIAAPLRRAVERAAGFRTAGRRAANLLRRLANRVDGQPAGWESGRLRLRVASLTLDATLWAHPCGRDKRLLIHLPPITADLSTEVRRQFLAHSGKLEGRPEPTAQGPAAMAP